MGDALDAPATEVGVGAAAEGAAAVVKEGNAEKSLEEEWKNYDGQYRLKVKEYSFRNQAENLWNLERGCVMANHQAALSGCTAF
ncbi:hypothetical protein H9L39_17473 [Fusarium oxysporum f. sp. albedinis]|nr:hypothetical protein H9L39_17473 [Fusarium oxysporum f. sp. albedinis]